MDAKLGTTNIDKILIGNTLYWQRESAPSHTVLNYLQSTGTQWINTGIKGRSGLKVELKVKLLAVGTTAFLFGSRINAGNAALCMVTVNSTLRSDYSGLSTATSGAINSDTDYIIKKHDNLQSINDVAFGSYSPLTFNNNLDMYLLACNTNGSASAPIQALIYHGKFMDENDVLLRDYIPVIKDGVYCLYDNVTQTYFYSQGTGSFTGN